MAPRGSSENGRECSRGELGLRRDDGLRLSAGRVHPVRLTGQDVGRGTFSHRHAGAEQRDGTLISRLCTLLRGKHRSAFMTPCYLKKPWWPLNTVTPPTSPTGLVVWEAQFDANGAQVVIDQFISGEDKVESLVWFDDAVTTRISKAIKGIRLRD